MKTLRTVGALACLLCVAGVAAAADETARAFTAKDLVMLDRVSDPQVAPDGQSVIFTVRETNWDANRGMTGLWRLALGAKESRPERLTATGSNASSPRWAADGKHLYFLSDRSGSNQVWRLGEGPGEARQVTRSPLEVENFALAPDGLHLALAFEAPISPALRSVSTITVLRRPRVWTSSRFLSATGIPGPTGAAHSCLSLNSMPMELSRRNRGA